MKSPRLLALLIAAAATTAVSSSPLLDSIAACGKRIFIAHRGVNLESTIAGENSIEAIGLSRRAGFDAIETDVRLSADDSLVVMHDATLNRTCLNADGTEIKEKKPVARETWKSLQENYVLKADSESARSRIPSLRNYLEECRRQNLLVFIEPKLDDTTGQHYRRIIETADAVLGRGNYIITSNNLANDVIRDTLGISDIPLMGILYQTTFDRVGRLGNVIMAVSATRLSPDVYTASIDKAKQHGLLRESHGNKFKYFDEINRHDVNIVSTDFLAPDNDAPGDTLLATDDNDLFGSPIVFAPGNMKPVEFGALYLEMEDIEGDATVTLGRQKFNVTDCSQMRHQVMLYNEIPAF